MKLEKLLDVDNGRLARSRDIQVKFIWGKMLTTPRKGFWSKLLGIIKNEPYIVTNLAKFKAINKKSGNEYICYLELKPANSYTKLLKSEAKIFCSCNDFKYRSAYVLNKENNLFTAPAINEHLGIAVSEKPRIVIPTPMCKHLVAVVDFLRNNLNKLNLTY